MVKAKDGLAFIIVIFVVAIAKNGASAAARELLDLPDGDFEQIYIPVNPDLPFNKESLALDEPPLVRMVTGQFQPEGIHLTPYGINKMMVSWQTGEPLSNSSETPPPAYDPTSVGAVVIFGLESGNLGEKKSVRGNTSLVYSYAYGEDAGGYTYQSPILHHVLLEGLLPGRTYFYRVGSEEWGFSDEMSFTSFNPEAKSLRIGIFGDIGDTANSSATVEALTLERQTDLVISLGDVVYADR